MSMREEDVLRAKLVADEEASVEEEVELGDDEGGVPGGAGAAEEGEILVGGWEFVFKYW